MRKPVFPLLFVSALLGLGLWQAWGSYPWWRAWDQPIDKWFPLLAGVLLFGALAVLADMAGMGIASLIGDSSDQIWRQCWKAEIVAMRSADGVSGSISGGIFMVSGQVGSNQVYHYYTLGNNGGLKPHSWTPDSDTTVFEEDRTDGVIIQFDSAFKRPWVEWFGLTNDRIRMDFHIPKGSLKREITIQ